MAFNKRPISTGAKGACILIADEENMENFYRQMDQEVVSQKQDPENKRPRNENIKDKKKNLAFVLREKNQIFNVQERAQTKKSGTVQGIGTDTGLDSGKASTKDGGAVAAKNGASIEGAAQPIPTSASNPKGKQVKKVPQPVVDKDDYVVEAFDEATMLRLGFAKCSKDHIYLVGENPNCFVCENMENKEEQSEDFRKYYTRG